ncbi:lipopolysaccharide-induced tumor necrosis factor-alpha factor homolog [Plakobranchus ocellatus]|uniref:Lipopolysaccharide-induced tumor necrosis factor-alpha factor homolog n=1 Tax=Plakobranchus ocellatus TaxID=259542 RepID=A0AAV4C629_9GAST|nr:lipopolysaccharide-induced tumor necrosis factor-alpha factor homolog [Plakobranchus ocellatus]
MSDTMPINPVATAPPSYTESQAQPQANVARVTEAKPYAARAPKDAPPPYDYPEQSPSSGYQRFDTSSGRRVGVVTVIELGPEPCYLQCPSCGNFIYTDTVYKTGALTCIASALCFFFCIICTCLPCFVKDCLDVDHYCPRCNYCFGTFTRL